MTTIILVRHAHVEGIDPPRFRGRIQLSLTELGRRQAELTAARIASSWTPIAVRTSPLERCFSTAVEISRACGVQPMITENLLDLNYGEWQGKTHEEARERWPELYARWRTSPQLVRFPLGESLQDMLLRSADEFRSIVEGFPDITVVEVGHDSINRALLLQLLNLPLSAYWSISQDPCCINVIECDTGAIRVASVNDISHLNAIRNEMTVQSEQ